MDSEEELKQAEYEDKVASLSRLHAHILFWMMRGFGYDEIGRLLHDQRVIDQSWDGDTVQRELTQIYEDLGYPKEMPPKTKNADLKKRALPAIKTLTNDDPKELDKFPLKQKPVNAQNRQSVDSARQWVDNNRQKVWISVGVLLFLVFVVGAFLLGRGGINPPPPTSILPTNTPEIVVTETLAQTATTIVTAQPTQTSAAALTSTPQPTLTPVATDTISPIGLVKGQELADNRVTLKFKEFRYEQGRTRVGQRLPAPIVFVFDFTNHSGEKLLLQLGQDKFRAEDNLGNKLTCEFWNGVTEAVEAIQQPLENEKTLEIGVFCGEGKIPPGVTTYTLYVTNFSSLPESTWVAPVVR